MGDCKGPLTCWTPHLHLPCRGYFPICFTLPLISWLPCASVCFRDICMWYGQYFPYVGGFGGIRTWGVHMLLLVHSCSSLGLMFLLWLWLLLLQLWWCLLGCHLFYQWPWVLPWWGFLQHWVSMKWFNHHPLCWEALEVYWPCLCATEATPIFDASSGLCQLWYGFSTGRFLF